MTTSGVDGAHRAVIDPIESNDPRPLWSVMIPTYNCAEYLRETLLSVLAQDPGPEQLQIEVVDDHSLLDDPAQVVEEIGKGRVGFHRQPANVGHIRNFETCLQRSRGHLIHQLHGDDSVRPGFYAKLGRAFADNSEIGAAFCRQIFMDERGHWQLITPLERAESGILEDWLGRIAVEQRLQTPAIVVRRDVYERLGGFDRRLPHCEDWEMWVRIAANYPVWYEVEPLALYRMNPTSLSKLGLRTGEGARSLRRAISIQSSYLPPPRAAELSRKARKASALRAISRGYELMQLRDHRAVGIHAREAIKSDPSPTTLRRSFGLIARAARRSITRP